MTQSNLTQSKLTQVNKYDCVDSNAKSICRTGSPIDTPPAAESPKKEPQPESERPEDEGLGEEQEQEDDDNDLDDADEVLEVGDGQTDEVVDQASSGEKAVKEAGDSQGGEVEKPKSPNPGSPNQVQSFLLKYRAPQNYGKCSSILPGKEEMGSFATNLIFRI